MRPACTVPHTVPAPSRCSFGMSFREAHVGRCPSAFTAPPGTARHIVPTQYLRSGQVCPSGGQVCGAAQVSRVAYEVPVGLREHPRSEAEGAAGSCSAAH